MVSGEPAPKENGTPTRAPGLLEMLLALLGSVALAMVYGWPAVSSLGSAVAGGDVDGYENVWNFWWVKTALFDLNRSVFATDYLYYPTGISLRFHTLNPLNGLITMPFNALLGYVTTLNLLMIASLAATVFCAYLLVRYFVRDGWAAFGGAAVGTLAGYSLTGIFAGGQTNLVSMEWLPLYLLFLLRSLHGPIFSAGEDGARRLLFWSGPRRLVDAVLAVAMLVLVSLVDWQYAMFAVFVTLLYTAYVLLASGRTWRERWLLVARMAAVGVAYTVLVGLPLVLPMVQEARDSPWLIVSGQSTWHSTDLAELLGPGLANPGYLAVALAVTGLVAAWRSGSARVRLGAAFWGVAALVFYIVSLGPQLLWAGVETGFPLPYLVMQKLPLFSIGRDPGRFTIVATLAVGVLCGYGLAALFAWLRSRLAGAPRHVAVAGATVLFVVVSLFGFVRQTWAGTRADPPEWPAFYEQIAADPEPYAVLDMPLFTEAGRGENHYMAYQVLHHKPRFGGRWARDHKLDNPNNFVKTTSLFRHFWLADKSENTIDQFYPEADFLERTDYPSQGRAILSYYNVRYIVLYKAAVTEDELPRYNDLIVECLGRSSRPIYNDDIMTVYRVPVVDTPPDNPLTLDVGNGWFAAATNERGTVYRWADSAGGQPSELYTSNLTHGDIEAQLSFTLYTFKVARTVRVLVDGAEVASVPVTPEDVEKQVTLRFKLPPGPSHITFASPEPPQSTGNPDDKRLLSFGMYGVRLARP